MFVLSGSVEPDDANQWRLYADQGRGYAIAFDPTASMVALADDSVDPPPTERVGFARYRDLVDVTPWLHVLYLHDEVNQALDESTAALTKQIDAVEQNAGSAEERDEGFEHLRSSAYDRLAMVAHLIKGPGFAGEHEVRVVTTFTLNSDHIKYRPSDHGLVGYVTLTGAPAKSGSNRVRWPNAGHSGASQVLGLPVTAVRLGPLLPEEHTNTVHGFLRKNGLQDVLIERSTVPLRSP